MMGIEETKKAVQELVDKYKRLLQSGKAKEFNEERTKNELIEPLFEALGWDVRNKYTEDEVTKEEKVSRKRVDYAFRINSIPKFFVEAKSLSEDIDDMMHARQAINYAYHKGVTWAVLTNFVGIRIFNAEWKTDNIYQSRFLSLDFDVFLEKFEKLWWLSKESFQNNAMDREAESVSKKTKKTPIDRQLLSDFMKWREILSKNIMKNNQHKKLTEEQLDEVVQRILDRLIFIRNCEDRGLEEKKLIEKAREWYDKENRKLVNYLREIFLQFNEHYDSKLFLPHLCDQTEIDNDVLYQIICGLYNTSDNLTSYDFSAIDADILGNMYEQYLGSILRKTEKRAKVEAKHAYRKAHGIYYTPTYIVDYIVRNTLGELLKDKKVDPEKIRILDPACGSGSFLIKAFDVISEHHKKKTNIDSFMRRSKILTDNIFGVDLDTKAVEIAQLNLLLKTTEKRHKLPMLQENIKCGNSLIDDPVIGDDKAFIWEDKFKDIMKYGGFDIVIGNPPYVRTHEFNDKIKQIFSKYKSSTGQYDIYVLFIEKAISLLKEGGLLGFIVSNKFLISDYGVGIRKYILENAKILKVIDVSNMKVFKDASVYPVIIILEKCHNDAKVKSNKFEVIQNVRSAEELYTRKGILFSQQDLLKKKDYAISVSSGNLGLIEKIEKESIEIGKIAKISRGFRPPPPNLIRDSLGKNCYKYLIGKDLVDAFRIKWSKHIVYYDESKIAESKPLNILLKPKILIRDISKAFNAALDSGDFVCLKTIYFISDSKYNLKYILGILNSDLMLYYFKSRFSSMHIQGGYLRFRKQFLEQIPIRYDNNFEEKIINLVDKLIELNNKLNNFDDKLTDERKLILEIISKTKISLNQTIYDLYLLNQNERKTIIEDLLKD